MPLLAFVPDPETSVTPGPEGTRGISEELAFPQQETKYTETQALPSLNPQGESVNSPNAGAHHVLSGNGGGAVHQETTTVVISWPRSQPAHCEPQTWNLPLSGAKGLNTPRENRL